MMKGYYTLKNSKRKALVLVKNPSPPLNKLAYETLVRDRLREAILACSESEAERILTSSLSLIGEESLLYLPSEQENWADSLMNHPLLVSLLSEEIPEKIAQSDLMQAEHDPSESEPSATLEAVMNQVIAGQRE